MITLFYNFVIYILSGVLQQSHIIDVKLKSDMNPRVFNSYSGEMAGEILYSMSGFNFLHKMKLLLLTHKQVSVILLCYCFNFDYFHILFLNV
jgi:hypothetical protein